MAEAIREIAKHELFMSKVRFGNKRYQHREISARFLLLIESLLTQHKVIDTKKVYLDSLTKRYKTGRKKEVNKYKIETINILDLMAKAFSKKDELLAAQGAMTVYFLVFREIFNGKASIKVNRKNLLQFKKQVKENRRLAEEDMEKANFDLLEFDRLSQQGTNDASSIKERMRILKENINLGRKYKI